MALSVLLTAAVAGFYAVAAAAAAVGGGGVGIRQAPHVENLVLAGRASASPSSTGRWGKAEEVPGISGLNAGGTADVQSVSCASADNCSAGGYYTDSSGHSQAFVVTETGGTWGTAEKVPGLAANASVTSVSCASAGNCSAGGYYAGKSANGRLGRQAFVVTETGGKWGSAEQVAAGLNEFARAEVTSVSCASAGNCSAGGYYSGPAGGSASERPQRRARFLPAQRRGGDYQPFVVDETKGTWGTAEEVPGTASTVALAEVTSVSCASAGNCSAGGDYIDSSGFTQAFVVNETKGVWGTAEKVPGTAALNTGASTSNIGASVVSVSCASAGNCSAGGYYTDSSGASQAFVVNETDGTWKAAQEVPGTATLNKGGAAEVLSVSCFSAGNCSAAGYYFASSDHSQAFVVDETSGKWGTAEEIPGIAALNAGEQASADSVSCVATGYCSAGGFYTDSSHHQQAFLVSRS